MAHEFKIDRTERKVNLRECIRLILSEALDVDISKTKLQHVHRSLVPMPDENKTPCPVIMRFHSFLERERVMAAVRKVRGGGRIMWRSSKISLFPNMTRDVAEKFSGSQRSEIGCTSWISVYAGVSCSNMLHMERTVSEMVFPSSARHARVWGGFY